MNELEQRLERIKKEQRMGLMTHIVVGYPSLPESKNLLKIMDAAGVDVIELQIPFSDPMADGPTIMQANQTALAHGSKVADTFRLLKEATARRRVVLLVMTYFNIIHHYGVEAFCRDAARAGASGLIVPDAPLEYEGKTHLAAYAGQNNLILIRLLSPASTRDRMIKNAAIAQGFIYFISRKGVTGSRQELDPSLDHHLRELRQYFRIPVAVGFGISRKEHVENLRGKAEMVVVGSGLINVYNQAPQGQKEQAVSTFLTELVAACQ